MRNRSRLTEHYSYLMRLPVIQQNYFRIILTLPVNVYFCYTALDSMWILNADAIVR